MTYPQAISYLESCINYEKLPAYPYKESLKLERVKGFLAALQNPQEALRCIHIAGSKGKGSTCAFLTYILREAGFRVGLYTSPHLVDFRERIRILKPGSLPVRQAGRLQAPGSRKEFEGMVSKKELAGLVQRLKPVIDRYNRNSGYGPLTFFEIYTALALLYFKEKKVDFAVLETGLGGRLDATNVVNPLVCAITPISYEHTDKLGNTLREIAGEKAGIIKNRCQVPVISAPQEKEAMQVIRKRCKDLGAPLYEVKTPVKHPLRLTGEHQLINAAVALDIIKALRQYNIKVSDKAIKNGLSNTIWPGRCEAVSRKPLIILDGAQNIASALALKKAIKDNFKYDKLILVLGISNDKDIKGICSELEEIADKVILTKASNPRSFSPVELAKNFPGKEKYIIDSVKEAKQKAVSLSGEKDLILITGSLFVVGEAR